MPRVLVMMSTWPRTPWCSAVPRPIVPRTPVACESSMTTTASYCRASSRMPGSFAMSPSIEKMPSVTIILVRLSLAATSFASRSAMSECL